MTPEETIYWLAGKAGVPNNSAEVLSAIAQIQELRNSKAEAGGAPDKTREQYIKQYAKAVQDRERHLKAVAERGMKAADFRAPKASPEQMEAHKKYNRDVRERYEIRERYLEAVAKCGMKTANIIEAGYDMRPPTRSFIPNTVGGFTRSWHSSRD